MFALLREKLDIVEVAEMVTEKVFKSIGDATFAPEDRECPHCGHKDCYRIKQDGADSFYKCFSCDETGDVTTMVATLKGISNVEAAKLLAKQFKIQLPMDYSPVQEAFNLAAEYYHSALSEAGPCAELGGLTPLEYQTQQRRHVTESMTLFHIGWSDGKLVEYLESLGIAKEIIAESGLVNKKGGDFLPGKAFIYPHLVRGRVSHFTFKDPLKQKEYQLPNKHKLNGHSFYNSDSIKKEGPIIVVEGENDCISVVEAGWNSGIVCCNGSISTAQLEWLGLHLANRDVITIFDADPAGDKYREKVGKLKRSFKTLTQIKLTSGVKDIDEYLKQGGDLAAALENNKTEANPTSEEDSSIEVDSENGVNILEKNGAYYKIRYKDGNEFHIKLTNFIITLRNIFIRGTEREREITIKREDGRESTPLMIPSEAKVSLKPFKTLAANAIDASFYGKEEDMIAIWEHVYKNSKETVVHLPEMVGRIEEFKGWLFGDSFISDVGGKYLPDENGVIWIQNHSVGIRAQSMETQVRCGSDTSGIPMMDCTLEEDEREDLIGGVLEKLGENLGNPGDALNILGWAWASVYSDEIFKAIRHFPFLYFWGRHGQGKTIIAKWILNMFDLEEPGWTPFPQLNSGVSFSRKLSYYSSMPMCIDEIRIDRNVQDMYGTFRAWYNRGGRTVSAKEGFGVRTQQVRSTLLFCGEDQFIDPATRERCIHIRVAKQGRELINSYKWIDDKKRDLPNIGYHWISKYSEINISSMLKDVKAIDSVLRQNGISSRISLNLAIIAYFANKLCDKYMPKFNYMEYLFESAKGTAEKQQEDDANNEFWGVVEGLQSEERARINSDHLKREGDKLYIWFAEIFRIVQREGRNSDAFSKRAILESVREEGYFIEEVRYPMGVNDTVRRVIAIDLGSAPEVLQNIAGCLG